MMKMQPQISSQGHFLISIINRRGLCFVNKACDFNSLHCLNQPGLGVHDELLHTISMLPNKRLSSGYASSLKGLYLHKRPPPKG